MHDKLLVAIHDLPFDEYNRRQLFESSADRILNRTTAVLPAGHFLFINDAWSPLKYEGAAVVSMVDENPDNNKLIKRLVEIQSDLNNLLEPKRDYYYLPKESFHQTIANTLSEARFKMNIVDAGLEEFYPNLVKQAFDKILSPNLSEPIRMKMTGLSVFGTAIGVLGIFENEEDYDHIIKFRSAFYDDHHLTQLNVRMTRHFIGHITLAYVESELAAKQKKRLADAVNKINDSLKSEYNCLNIATAELRRYYHLAEFIRHEGYPIFNFLQP
jgi:hypothetical protein